MYDLEREVAHLEGDEDEIGNGGKGADQLEGNGGNDVFKGGKGVDQLRGRLGDDILDAVDGAPGDVVSGQLGFDKRAQPSKPHDAYHAAGCIRFSPLQRLVSRSCSDSSPSGSATRTYVEWLRYPGLPRSSAAWHGSRCFSGVGDRDRSR